MKPSSLSAVVGGLDDLRCLVETFAGVLAEGDVIGLNGHLGSGKTTFVKMLAEPLGVTDNVSSPTFTLVHRYRLPPLPSAGNDGRGEVAHTVDRSDASSLASIAGNDGGEVAHSKPKRGRSVRYMHHVDAYRIGSPQEADDLDLPDLLDGGRDILVVEWAERLALPADRLDVELSFVDDPADSSSRRLLFWPLGSWRDRPLRSLLEPWLR